MLAMHLVWLFTHCPYVHHLLYGWYSGNLPGMPRGYIDSYVKWQAHHYPRGLRTCLTGLEHHRSNHYLLNVCP